MASRGQKFNSYTSEFRKEILAKYFANEGSASSLAKEYNIPCKTIKNWVTKHNKGLDIVVDHRENNVGRKKEQDIDYKERYEILKNYQAFLKAQREKK